MAVRVRRFLKSAVQSVSLALVFPSAALASFGRWKCSYAFFANAYALVPGKLGDYIRVAFYKLTLQQCSLDSCVSFGTFFAHPDAILGAHVYIGSYCVLGRTIIGERTQIASGVQILSGKQQHSRDASGRVTGSEQGTFTVVTIGADCWIGAAAIVMTDIGAGSTVGAGSVVTKPIPRGSLAVGNPARVVGPTTAG